MLCDEVAQCDKTLYTIVLFAFFLEVFTLFTIDSHFACLDNCKLRLHFCALSFHFVLSFYNIFEFVVVVVIVVVVVVVRVIMLFF